MYFTPETQKVIDEVVQAHYGDQIREACAETHEKAHAEGLAEGLAEGQAQTLKEIVCNALRKNKSFEVISEITDLPISEIEKIQQEMMEQE